MTRERVNDHVVIDLGRLNEFYEQLTRTRLNRGGASGEVRPSHWLGMQG